MPDPLAVPARLAIAGDWHANLTWMRKAVGYAADRGAEVILHLGDYGYQFTPAFRRGAESILAQAGIPLLFVDGNHDDQRWLHRITLDSTGIRHVSDHVWHLPRGFRWEWDDIRLMALGGAHSVDRPWRVPGESWWPEESLTDEDVRYACASGRVDVLLIHDAPAGVVIPGVDDRSTPAPWSEAELLLANAHREKVRHVVQEVNPLQVWHGHYHVAYERVVEFVHGPTRVVGLAHDGTSLAANVRVMDLTDLGKRVERDNRQAS